MGVTRRKRQSRAGSAASPRLHALALASPSVTENTVAGHFISAILEGTAGSTLTLVDNAGGRFAISSGMLMTGAVVLDREMAESHAITFRETLTGYANSPRDTVLMIAVLNQFEAPDLGALSLSRTSFAAGFPESGGIIGAAAGSVLSASGLPLGLTIDGAARSWVWDGSGPVSSGSLSLTEAHADAGNSPRANMIGWEIAAAPSIAISDEFPALKAAYESGERALIAWIGDSTVANAGGLLEENSTAHYLREYLSARGLTGVIGGCFSSGDKGLTLTGMTVAAYGAFYQPDATFDASFEWFTMDSTAFGSSHAYSSVAGDKVRYDPGLYYDRVELFYPTFAGAGTFDLTIGSGVVASIDGDAATSITRMAPIAVARTNAPIDQVVTSGYGWPGTVRVWDSTASRKLQVENLGVCGYRCSDWIDTGARRAGNTLAISQAQLVIIQLGVNEMNTGVSAATYQANLTTLINNARAADRDVLVCLPAPATAGYAMDADHRAAVSAACTAAGIGAPVDLFGGIDFDTETDLTDTVHPNASGNYKIVYGAAGVGARIVGEI